MIHDFKSALKYSKSNLGNQQGDLKWKIAKKPLQVGFSYLYFCSLLGWVFWCQPCPLITMVNNNNDMAAYLWTASWSSRAAAFSLSCFSALSRASFSWSCAHLSLVSGAFSEIRNSGFGKSESFSRAKLIYLKFGKNLIFMLFFNLIIFYYNMHKFTTGSHYSWSGSYQLN